MSGEEIKCDKTKQLFENYMKNSKKIKIKIKKGFILGWKKQM